MKSLPLDSTEYKEQRRKYIDIKSKAKSESRREFEAYRSITLRDSLQKNPKEFWSYVRETRGKQSTVLHLIDENGEVITDAHDKANIINQHFKKCFTVDDGCVNTFPSRVTSIMNKLELNEEGIRNLLSQVDSKKSPGPEGVPAFVISKLANELSPLLLAFFSKSLEECTVPASWKIANVTPVPKKGRKTKPDDFRPISLTSIFCKVLEHIICSYLMRFLSENAAITPSQHGFRKGRSCESQLALLNHDIMQAADEGFRTDAIFLDFRKAFDTVPRPKLIQKLKAYGINDQITQWIVSFLTCRSQRVVLDGVYSDEIDVTSGVPQGSVIGPILFLIYINDIVDNVKSNVRLFADDTLIYRKIQTTEDSSILQRDLDVISKWCKDWQLGLNIDKCVAMSMTRSPIRHSSQSPYRISGAVLEFVSQYKYLGVSFSSNLSFRTHIRDIVGSADRTLRLCNRILRGSQTSVKEVAYLSLVRPLLEFCCETWNPHEKGLILELERVQRRAARFVKGDYRFDSSVSEMIKSLGWNSLEDRRLDCRHKLFEKFLSSDLHDEIRDIVIPAISERDLRDQTSKKFREILARTDSYYWSLFPDSIRRQNRVAI